MSTKGFSENRPAGAAVSFVGDPLDAALARRVLESAPTVIYVYDVQKERVISRTDVSANC
ncbi:MAG TPA: hypothetical protein VF410_11080 [Rhizomicrobium sp.]